MGDVGIDARKLASLRSKVRCCFSVDYPGRCPGLDLGHPFGIKEEILGFRARYDSPRERTQKRKRI